MRDNFKDYIDKNADEFQHTFDADKGWKDFKKSQPKSSSKRIWLVAASVTMLLTAGIVFLNLDSGSEQELTEIQEIEMFYQDQIDQMTQLVVNLSDDEEILYDLEMMDKAFAEVKADLNDDAASEEVLEAMMNHYRLKVKILERMLEEIRENETEDISRL